MSEYDYALIENTRAAAGENPIVACACLHAVPGYYGSVRLQFGKPEVIATHPNYRNQGLVRRLLEDMIHPASDERGDVVQFILGLPHFYLYAGTTFLLLYGISFCGKHISPSNLLLQSIRIHVCAPHRGAKDSSPRLGSDPKGLPQLLRTLHFKNRDLGRHSLLGPYEHPRQAASPYDRDWPVL